MSAGIIQTGSARSNARATSRQIVPITADALHDDPIFAAIERHRVLQEALDSEKYGRGKAEEARLQRDIDICNQAADDIMNSPFTTLAGSAAAVRWMIKFDLEWYDYCKDSNGAFLRRLADALDAMGARS